MSQRQLLKVCCAVLFGLAIFGFWNERGSAKDDPEERKLEAFIEAAAAVDGVMAAWQTKIVLAEDHETEGLRNRANDEIRESIEQVDGISFTEYREIRHAIAADPDMLARVKDIMRRQRQD